MVMWNAQRVRTEIGMVDSHRFHTMAWQAWVEPEVGTLRDRRLVTTRKSRKMQSECTRTEADDNHERQRRENIDNVTVMIHHM